MKIFERPLFAVIIFLFAIGNIFASSPVIMVDGYKSLRMGRGRSMLFGMHSMITNESAPQSFYFPRKDSSWKQCLNDASNRYLFLGKSENSFIGINLVGGLDYKGGESLNDTIWPGIDGGVQLQGYLDLMDFYLDARIYSEGHFAESPRSYDGEFFDYQKGKKNDGVDYVSYARYRGHLAFNTKFGRLDFARDVYHWGPGYYNNLTLNQFALPFNSLSFETKIGPLTVYSLYGDLRIDSLSTSFENTKSRNLYAHRYELSFSDIVVGMSELQIVYDNNNPWLFIPIVPLFIEKSNYTEESNNGALSFDINYRMFNFLRIYSELFIDDLQSPITLIKNEHPQDKWAWMVGLHYAKNMRVSKKNLLIGSLIEYSRIEPYVYTHFKENSAQIAHLGKPLGNPNGPNSQVVDWSIYGKYDNFIEVVLLNQWLWKGNDLGSALNDTTPPKYQSGSKRFLQGAELEYSLIPSILINTKYAYWMIECSLFYNRSVLFRFGFKF